MSKMSECPDVEVRKLLVAVTILYVMYASVKLVLGILENAATEECFSWFGFGVWCVHDLWAYRLDEQESCPSFGFSRESHYCYACFFFCFFPPSVATLRSSDPFAFVIEYRI